MKNKIYKAAIILSMGFITYVNPTETMAQTEALSSNQNSNDMSSFISIFEIPATDLSRAVNFYQAILNIKIEKMEMPGMEMGIFPYEGQLVTGVIVKGDGYNPSADGVTIYLNGGDNLQIILDKVEESGGKIIVPKTPHADESGFFAMFLDTEGNKMGLHSPN
ncbi:VOC family protein [Marinoscillum sp. 108]|uniref:VOC family protein n=1 Tax=Marinoscillum sp. 108 TaxID=2653151 RepID=UPI0012F45BCE|nr:VOC family protein [Marinoscillum sp. 108]VXD10539.1 Glyoxalase [Marinoscillum sp. 108]